MSKQIYNIKLTYAIIVPRTKNTNDTAFNSFDRLNPLNIKPIRKRMIVMIKGNRYMLTSMIMLTYT